MTETGNGGRDNSGGVRSGSRVMRTCLGCRGTFSQDQLVRYVLSPDGDLLVDYRGKLPGRGAYTCIHRDCIRQAVQRRQFQRSFRTPPREVDGNHLIASLEEQILKRILALLGMARKSSCAVSGTQAVVCGFEGGEQFRIVFLASDMSSDIADKVRYKAGLAGVSCYSFFDKGTMGRITGKSESSVVGVRNLPLAEAIRIELLRLEQISGES
ncbi:MAG: DUF448 domain-containing protein [Desulfuromonadaceae bacterium]|nr:DUF448 domain-containing protein [Desulfuromonadaceae bacterium]